MQWLQRAARAHQADYNVGVARIATAFTRVFPDARAHAGYSLFLCGFASSPARLPFFHSFVLFLISFFYEIFFFIPPTTTTTRNGVASSMDDDIIIYSRYCCREYTNIDDIHVHPSESSFMCSAQSFNLWVLIYGYSFYMCK